MKVMINNESSFFHGMVGTLAEKQSKPGVWVMIAATAGGVARRLWFTKGELVEVNDD